MAITGYEGANTSATGSQSMSWTAIGAAAVKGAASIGAGLGGGMLSYLTDKKLMRRQVHYQKELMRYEQQLNSPVNQMRMLKQANLNPNLVYGSGGGYVPVHTSGAPSGGNIRFDVDPNLDLLGAIKQEKENEILEKQKELLEAQKQNVSARTEGQKSDNVVKSVQAANAKTTGSTSPTWAGLATGLIRKGVGFILGHKDEIMRNLNPMRDVVVTPSREAAANDYKSDSHQGRQGLTVDGRSVEDDANVRLHGQQIDGAYLRNDGVEIRKLTRQEALELEARRRRANGIKERQRKQQEYKRAYERSRALGSGMLQYQRLW